METNNYSGRIRIANEHAELSVTTDFGPRILSYNRPGGPNAFAVLPDTGDNNVWKPYGGHRIWIAPEKAGLSDAPDNVPAIVKRGGESLVVGNEPAEGVGIGKEMTITLAKKSSAVRIDHRLWNAGDAPVTAASWGLSIVAEGGYVAIPQEPFVAHGDSLLPVRPLVLWSYTDMADSRWRWGSKYLTLTPSASSLNKPQKVGLYNGLGWAAHITQEQVFVTRIPVSSDKGVVLPDMGCNYETYTDGLFQELETLGPLVRLQPGESTEHTEYWYLAAAQLPIANTDAALDERLLPIVDEADRAFAELR